ncbi:MAG: hypothetical protein LH629_01310 [Ignavibacteria bacterium]|nr:hypothetical protein [Ignavibacteria bacterium]
MDKINDKHLINAIKELIKFAYQKKEEHLLTAFTEEQIMKRTQQSEKNIKQRKFKSVAAMRNEIKNW